MRGAFSTSDDVVVTVLTCGRCLAVIDGVQRRNPGLLIMAAFTQIAAERMTGGFGSAGTDAVVTTGRVTRSTGLGMIKGAYQGQIINLRMAQFTRIHTGRMIGALACGNGVVVARDTGIGSLTMIKRQQGRTPDRVAMTQLTGICGDRVVSPLTRSHTGSIVTAGTEAGRGGFAMSKRTQQRNPGRVTVTSLTVVATGWMIATLTGRLTQAIVATGTKTGRCSLRVIERRQQ